MNSLAQEKPYHAPDKPRAYRSKGVELLDNLARRWMDIFISVASLIGLFPFFVLVALMIKKDSQGPIFYWGKRVGKGGREFDILKFRTMYETQESYKGPKLTADGDTRVTPIGAWLRSTKINEIPQLWNVLRGEMSLVGPRPEDPEFVKKWPLEARNELLSVRPGITSPASVIYRDEEKLFTTTSVMDEYLRSILPSKLRLDQLYVRNRSLFSDLDVLFWTMVVLIPQARREEIPEAKLYWGPLSVFMAHDVRWFLTDFMVVLLSTTGIGVIWRTITPLHIGWTVAPLIAFAMAVVFSLGNALRGLNRVYWAKASPGEALDLLLTSIIATILLWLSDRFLLTRINVPVGLFVFGGLVAYLGFVAVRYRERILTGLGSRWLSLRRGGRVIGERLLIVGAGELGQFATWLIRKGTWAQAFTLIGMVDDDPRKQGMRIDGVKVLGSTQEIENFVKENDIGIVLFAISNIHPDERFRILSACQALSVRIVMIPNVVEIMRNEFRLGMVNGSEENDTDHLSVSRMRTWLKNLDTFLEAKDYEAVQTHVEFLRGELADKQIKCKIF
ncbi:MAG: hypothetical protein HC806_07775 [Anaerolineae bacterium]|nr:hypothetical protein [Anaerolineae bacterium]